MPCSSITCTNVVCTDVSAGDNACSTPRSSTASCRGVSSTAPWRSPGRHAHRDVEAGVAEVERPRPALVPVADDGDARPRQGREVGVLVVEDRRHLGGSYWTELAAFIAFCASAMVNSGVVLNDFSAPRAVVAIENAAAAALSGNSTIATRSYSPNDR